MNKICGILVIFLIIISFNGNTEEQQKDSVREQIQKKMLDFLVDLHEVHLNFGDRKCSFCEENDLGKEIEDLLNRAGFHRIETSTKTSGHCGGITLLFIRHLLSNPPKDTDSCKQIIQLLTSDKEFVKNSHVMSVNRLTDYVKFFENALSIGKVNSWIDWWNYVSKKEQENILHDFFSNIIDQPVDCVYHHPPDFTAENIYQGLQSLSNKVVLVSYTNGRETHCLAICTNPDKLLVFDSNEGLYQFRDLESLSWVYEKILRGYRPTFIISFPMIDSVP